MPLTFDKVAPPERQAAGQQTSALRKTLDSPAAAQPTALETFVTQHIGTVVETVARKLRDQQQLFKERHNTALGELEKFSAQHNANMNQINILTECQEALEDGATPNAYNDNIIKELLRLKQAQRELQTEAKIPRQILQDLDTSFKSTQTRATRLIFIAQLLQEADCVGKFRTEIQAETKLPTDRTREDTNALLQKILEQSYQTLIESRHSKILDPASQEDQPTLQLLMDIGNLPEITIAALRQILLDAIVKHESSYLALDIELQTSLVKRSGQSPHVRTSPEIFEAGTQTIEKNRQQSQQTWDDLLKLLPMNQETCTQLLYDKKQHLIISRLKQLDIFNEHTSQHCITKITRLLKLMAENRELLTSPGLLTYFNAIQDALVKPKDTFNVTEILKAAHTLQKQLTDLWRKQQEPKSKIQMQKLCDALKNISQDISPLRLVADAIDAPCPEGGGAAAEKPSNTLGFSPTP